MREKSIAVAVVADKLGQFLIVWNSRWGCYTFPMKDYPREQVSLPSSAIKALEEDAGRRLPGAASRPLGYVGRFGHSGATGEDTLYEYWAYEVDADLQGAFDAAAELPRWLDFDNLVADPEIDPSAKEIARAFVENQNVAVAVIPRLGRSETEYLVVWSANYGGLFFPATRMKDELKADAGAQRAVRYDLEYPDETAAEIRGDVPDAHFSRRYNRDRAFRFQICEVALPGLDLNQPFNLLETRMKSRGLRWVWVTADQLRNPPDPISPTLAAVRNAVLQFVPPVKRPQPIRTSEAALALIRRTVDGRTEWLAQRSDSWQALSLIGGHLEIGETYRDCVIRETAEELGLTYLVDFTVALAPTYSPNYVAYSHSANEDTAYSIELFDVVLRPSASSKIDANPDNRWLAEAELLGLQASDGRRISDTMPMLLAMAGLLANCPATGRRKTEDRP